MRSCFYCGRQNEDSAANCMGCGTRLDAPSVTQNRKRAVLSSPGGWVCLIAVVLVLQGVLRLEFTPHDPNLGEGDYKRVSAALHFWLSLCGGLVLLGYGFYLMRRRANEIVGQPLPRPRGQ